MLKAAVIGATGVVGQRIVKILSGHPWFELSAVCASEKSAGKTYWESTRWKLPDEMPEAVRGMEVKSPTPDQIGDIDVVFSALPADLARGIEEDCARAGHVVVSNASAHRMDPTVPLLNPEVNADHVDLIEVQRKERKWDGAIVTNANCTAAVLALSLKPIHEYAGLKLVVVSSMQAVSGAGYPGVPSLDIIDNVIPYIPNEEEKVEEETVKMLGSPTSATDLKVSASCHRVAVIDGHMEAVFLQTKRKVTPDELREVMTKFRGEPQERKLPSAPDQPIIVRSEVDRPQTRFDRLAGNGMSVVVGRLREDPALAGIKYVVLGHNLMRGAAGCTVLNAELLKARGYL